ncbi:putative G-protein coupled receptor 156 [Rhinophrynus dorsalis]
MEPSLNCSELSQSHVDTSLDRQEALLVLQELCRVSGESDTKQISATVLGISGTLLCCGLLLSLFFSIFTIRFRRNRIVKMSSPNLNLVTLLGSSLNYISAFLFMVPEHTVSMETIFQVRISLLYVGVSLVFGPLLGKSWRLHRVFTHRVPDKRVIIKDMTLLILVAMLLFADTLLLLTWVLSDPVLCVRSATASIRSTARGTFGAVSRTDFCASVYGDLWTGLLVGSKGALLIYGSYLAGLTNNISSPPVNQSLAIMVGSGVVIVATLTVFLVNRFLHTRPSLVYGITSGSILVCTTAINCLIFIPQLLQSRRFEEEQSQSSQMAKYFNSPSKSFRSMYSEEQIYHLLGENTSMRRLLTEKNAVIESLQEQVNSAKDKLMKLLKSECSYENAETTSLSVLSPSTLAVQHQEPPVDDQTINGPNKDPTPSDTKGGLILTAEVQGEQKKESSGSNGDASQVHGEDQHELQDSANDESQYINGLPGCSISKPSPVITSDSKNVTTSNDISKEQFQHSEEHIDNVHEAWEQLSRKVNYVSSEKLQEILKELSVETLSGSSYQSPKKQRRASHSVHREPAPITSDGDQKVCLSLSPYMMRRRRGHWHGHRNLPSSTHFSRAMPPPAWYLINKGAITRCNGVKSLRDERNGIKPFTEERLSHTDQLKTNEAKVELRYNHSTPLAMNTEQDARVKEDKKKIENGGLYLTTQHHVSDNSDNPTSPIPVRNRNHTDLDTHGMVTLAELSPQTYFSETDSTSSEETICYCHRPCCELCFQNTCDSSDSYISETESCDSPSGWTRQTTHLQTVVNFNEDLKPTFV